MVKGTVRETVRGFIPPGALEGPQLLRIVIQGLDRVIAAEEREAALNLALANSSLGALPSTAAELTAFVFGPLRDAVERLYGADPAERVLLSLTPFLKQACRHEKASPDASPSQPPEAAPTSSQPAPAAEAPSVLLVEHDAKSRAQLASVLRGRGFEVFTAPDGHVALAVTMRNRPDLVIASMSLPVVGGRQLMALLRVAFASEAPPVLLLSDADDAPSRLDDAKGLLTRPVEPDDLIAQVEAVLRERDTPRAPR